MDNRNKYDEQLGVNKMGKNIRKSPLQQPNFANTNRQQPQPQVYNINKNDFRNIVQQLTGSPSQEPLPRPPHNPPKPPSMRLQKIRPPPLATMNRPQIPVHHPAPAQALPMPAAPVPYGNAFVRPPTQFSRSLPTNLPLTPANSVWENTAESPISAYMRYLQNSIIDSGPRQTLAQLQLQPQPQPQFQNSNIGSGTRQTLAQPQLQAQFQNSIIDSGQRQTLAQPQPQPQPRFHPQPQVSGQILDRPPSSVLLPYPPVPSLPSPRMSGPPLLPSPTSQFPFPSPTGFLNFYSPQSPYPLLSPGYHFPPPPTPNFSFSPMAQSGILGPGPQPPLSPGIAFPLSPSGFFSIPSPGWRSYQ